MTITIIAAVSENRVIGRDGGLPWHLPADLKRFKAITSGHTVILGRKTMDALGRPLPGRRHIVVTRDPAYRPGGVAVAHSLDAALAQAGGAGEVYILGGGEIYRQALPRADRLELTIVHAEVNGDTWFPEIDPADWTLVAEEDHPADERNEHAYSFLTYERRRRG